MALAGRVGRRRRGVWGWRLNPTREIAVVLPPPGKDPSAADIADVIATCARIGVKVRVVAHDAPDVLMAVASEHADPEAFRRRVDMDNLMREMADPFADIGLPDMTGWAGEAKPNRVQRRREARRLAKVRRW